MKVSKEEFNKFWNEILGKDWYIDDDDVFDVDFVDDQDPEVLLSNDGVIAWQGHGRLNKSSLPKYVKSSEYDTIKFSGFLTIGLLTLFKRWKKNQSHTTFCAYFTVKKDEEDELREALKCLGARFSDE